MQGDGRSRRPGVWRGMRVRAGESRHEREKNKQDVCADSSWWAKKPKRAEGEGEQGGNGEAKPDSGMREVQAD